MEKNTAKFTSWVHKFGISSSLLLLVLMVAFPVIVSMVYNVWPNFSMLIPGILSVVLTLVPWWPAETFGYMTTMGPGALYMSYITGNVTNLHMPATVGTINSLGIEPNTDECHTMAIIACGASNITTVLLLLVGMLASVPLAPVLSAPVLQPAFTYALPALFGGLCAQSVIKGKKKFGMWAICLAVCVFFCYCTKVNSAYYMLISVALGAALFYFFDYKQGAKTAPKADK